MPGPEISKLRTFKSQVSNDKIPLTTGKWFAGAHLKLAVLPCRMNTKVDLQNVHKVAVQVIRELTSTGLTIKLALQSPPRLEAGPLAVS